MASTIEQRCRRQQRREIAAGRPRHHEHAHAPSEPEIAAIGGRRPTRHATDDSVAGQTSAIYLKTTPAAASRVTRSEAQR
jgi:hypothetical protein